MIQIRNLSLSFKDQKIFNGISLYLEQDQRVGVLGRNGSGKSTLLKTLAGQIKADEGEFSFSKGKTIAYMAQEIVLLSDKTVIDETLSIFEDSLRLKERKHALEEQFKHNDTASDATLEEYLEIQQKLENFDYNAIRNQALKILTGLGFKEKNVDQAVSSLSEGWKMRIILAKLLLQKADFYLFDEPTNHLDLAAQEWFFQFLRQNTFGFLLVTHDKYYLDNACDSIIELERGKIHSFNGNYTKYLVHKQKEQEVIEASYQRQQREIEKKQEIIDKFRAKATKAKMAQSMIKQLDKLERIEIEDHSQTMKFNFPPIIRSGTVVLKVENLRHTFDNALLFHHINTEILRGEKVGLVAPNGTGKTTLFNLLVGKYSIQQGTIKFGHNVKYAVFEQDQIRSLNADNTIFEEVLASCPQRTEAMIRSLLGSFLFSNDAAHKKINVLSGGERNRVAMVKILLHDANFLLLDEPTNHLDLQSKEVLLKALQDFEGTILMVCHDHDFLNRSCNRILELTHSGLISYPGNYEFYLEHKKEPIQAEPQADQFYQKLEQSKGKSNFLLRKEASSLETKIERLELEIVKINNDLCNYTYGSNDYTRSFALLQEKQNQLNTLLQQWELVQNQIDT